MRYIQKYISDKKTNSEHDFLCLYLCNSFIVDLRHTFAVRNMNEIPAPVQSSELSNKTCPATEVYAERVSPILHLLFVCVGLYRNGDVSRISLIKPRVCTRYFETLNSLFGNHFILESIKPYFCYLHWM